MDTLKTYFAKLVDAVKAHPTETAIVGLILLTLAIF